MKLLKKIFILNMLLCFSFGLQAQNEGNIWYFGQNAGIDFNSGTAVAIGDGAMVTNEGCASICDNNGNLLFYTDGSTVYNANHQVMPNGTGLMGNGSSTQSAIILKKPGSSSIYYVFTVDAIENVGANGIRYSVVDMSLQGGLGDVTTLNVLVIAPCHEKITVVKHQNGIDFWVVCMVNTQSNFLSFLVTSSGVNLTPITSSSVNFFISGSGYLKVNPLGDKIATSTVTGVQVFDFDNATGLASNAFVISPSFSYGLEFSPNSQYLYLAKQDTATNTLLVQYNLYAGSTADIVASELVVDTTSQLLLGAFQLAPDNKIYISLLTFLSNQMSVIANPNSQGSNANFQFNSFQLASGTFPLFGLPNFYNQALATRQYIDTIACTGDSITLQNSIFQNHNWALANSPSVVFSTDSAITVAPNVNTSYLLFDGLDSVFFNITVSPSIVVDLGPDIANCDQNSMILTDLNNTGDTSMSFLWQDGSTNDSLVTNLVGTYILTVNSGACSDSDTVEVFATPGVVVTSNNPNCTGTPTGSIIVNVPGSSSDFTFLIENSDSVQVNTVGTNAANNLVAGWYQITYTSSDGCVGVTVVELIDPLEIQTTLALTSPLCHGEAGGTATVTNIINYQGDFNDINYIWTPNPQNNNGLLTDAIFGLVAGEYNLEVIDDFGCINSQVFFITEPNPLQAVISDNIPAFCRTADFQSGNGVLAAEVPGETSGTPPISFGWQNLTDGQTANTSTVVMRSPGQVVLIIKDDNNCIYRDTVLLDSLNPIADFIIESDEFTIPEVYEGTELLSIKVTNLSQNFAQSINPNSDTIFQWSLDATGVNPNWFFTYAIDDKVDTTYEGEKIYQVCLIAKNYNDCADTLCKDVIVHAFPELLVPNVFTPGSSPNSHFYFPAKGIQDFECTIFNRYGVLVYQFTNISDQWDGNHFKTGKACSDGVYSYVYKAMSTNSTPFRGEGQVTLIRAE